MLCLLVGMSAVSRRRPSTASFYLDDTPTPPATADIIARSLLVVLLLLLLFFIPLVVKVPRGLKTKVKNVAGMAIGPGNRCRMSLNDVE